MSAKSPSEPTPLRPEPMPNERDEPVHFYHPAEEAFARILDFYQIEWQYEPTTFPLEWDEDGRVITAFAPDFYLVEDDLYVELTTMKQRHVTAKNRKLRLLRELYPDVKCKLMYRRDIANLGVKYGLFENGPLPRLCPDVEAREGRKKEKEKEKGKEKKKNKKEEKKGKKKGKKEKKETKEKKRSKTMNRRN